MPKLTSLTLLLLIATNLFGRPTQMSEEAYVSIITVGTGTEVHTLFGHSAIRVVDPTQDFDEAYNYGMFSFGDDQVDFIVKFVRGKLTYWVESYPFKQFYLEYLYNQRTLYEQILDLEQSHVQKIYELLEENTKEANKYYLYDFFYDNCSSRIRDVLRDALGDDLEFNLKYYKKGTSFRQLVDPYLEKAPSLDFGTDLMMGVAADVKAEAEDYMFLPDYLYLSLESATFEGRPLLVTQETDVILEFDQDEWKEPFLRPTTYAWFFFIFVLFLTLISNQLLIPVRILDPLVFFLTGLIGSFFVLCWVSTDHDVLPNNLNVIWAFPGNLILFVLMIFKKKPAWFIKWLKVYSAILTILLISWPIFPQSFHAAVFPIILTLLLRCLMHIEDWREKIPFLNKLA